MSRVLCEGKMLINVVVYAGLLFGDPVSFSSVSYITEI